MVINVSLGEVGRRDGVRGGGGGGHVGVFGGFRGRVRVLGCGGRGGMVVLRGGRFLMSEVPLYPTL